MKKLHPLPKRVQPENRRIFRITQFAYLFGLIGHLMMVITFHQLNIKELLWFNILYSIPAFSVALVLNRRGHHDLAFLFAFIELYSNQFYGVYLLGWDTGFQYFLIYLAGLSFFIDHWKKRSQVAILSLLKPAQILEELRLKALLQENHPLSMKEQKECLEKTLSGWMADHEQTDDISLIGLKM